MWVTKELYFDAGPGQQNSRWSFSLIGVWTCAMSLYVQGVTPLSLHTMWPLTGTRVVNGNSITLQVEENSLYLNPSEWNACNNILCFCCAEKKGEIDKLAEEYMANVKNLASEQRVEHLQKIQNAYSKCKEFSDDKVQLAMQTYEMVSQKIFVFYLVTLQYSMTIKEVTIHMKNVSHTGGQTHSQTGCRSGTVWEWAERETGSERLWKYRWKSAEK